jgi:hypothetical protein
MRISRPTLWQSSSSASLRLRGLLLRRFLRDLPVPGISTLLAAVDRFLRRERVAAGVTGACVRPPEAPPVALLDVPMEFSEDLFFPAGM